MNDSHSKPELVRCVAEHKWVRAEAQAVDTGARVTLVESHAGYDHYIINKDSNLTRKTERSKAPEETRAQPARNRLFSFGSEGSPNSVRSSKSSGV